MSAIGVADGVGGWASEGIDSGLYSRELMSKVNIECNIPLLHPIPHQAFTCIPTHLPLYPILEFLRVADRDCNIRQGTA